MGEEHVSKDVSDDMLEEPREVQGLLSRQIVATRPTSVGPSNVVSKRVGLNVKSQVRFKNIKSTARSSGPLPMLSMPLLNNNVNIVQPGTNCNDTSQGGSIVEVEVFNHRPPDDVHEGVLNEVLQCVSAQGGDAEIMISDSPQNGEDYVPSSL
ncbi:phosphoribosylformylglycinamidine synthase [Sesbania bispinosa]|nr:phosphoribosylformylglycinamidine synthase [Sesbania bispinosa]